MNASVLTGNPCSSTRILHTGPFTTPLHLVVAVAPSAEQLRDIGSLRARVWHAKGVEVIDFDGGDAEVWLDEWDAAAIHWLVYDGERLVACARVSIHDDLRTVPDFSWLQPVVSEIREPVGSLMRLVVEEPYRGRGIAQQLDALRLRFLLTRGVATAAAIAVGPQRVQALEKQGFVFKYWLPEDHGLMTPSYPLGVLLFQANATR